MGYTPKNPKFNSTILSDVAAGSVDAPKLGSHKLINRNGQIFIVDDTGAETEVGSAGSGEINYIEEWNAETAIANWNTYKDAAQSTPEDGTNGTANITFTRQNSIVLRGRESFKITKDAFDRQGEGASYDFTIKGQDVSKKLKIQFDFKTDEDAGYASNDLTVYIYDVTNSTLITPVDTGIVRGQNIFQTSFNSTTSTSYRLIFHIATSNASAWNAYIDNIIVGPGMTSQGAAVGPWELSPLASSSTIAGTTIAGSVAYSFREFRQRRVGDSMEVQGRFVMGTITTAPTGTLTFTKMFNETVDTSLQGSATIIGNARYLDVSASVPDYSGTVLLAASGSTLQVAFDGANDGAIPVTMSSGDQIYIYFTVPITEWAGKGIVPMLAEDNLSEWQTFDLTLNNFSIKTASSTAMYRRVGQNAEIKFVATHNGAGSGGDIIFDVSTNLGLTQDVSQYVGSNNYSLGSGFARDLNGASAATTIIPNVYPPLPDNIYFIETDGTAINNIDGSDFSDNDYFSVSFSVPIVEWAGSQNSLVGYAEATEDNLGLVKKNKWQVKILGSDKTTNGTFLTFNNLVVGKAYRIICQANIICEVDDTVGIQIIHDSNALAETKHRLGPASAGLAFGDMNSTTMAEAIFVATATTATCDAFSIGAPSIINADGTRNLTWAMIEELNNYEAETTDFT